MRTYYCKKCGTANEIEETMEKFFCANCGTENSVPQKVSSDTASKPVSGDKPAETSSFIYGSVDMAASKEPDEKTEYGRTCAATCIFLWRTEYCIGFIYRTCIVKAC